MPTASSPRGRRSGALRSARSSAGAHARRPRGGRRLSLAVLALVLAVGLSWLGLRVLLPDGSPAPAASTTNPSATADVGVRIRVAIGDAGTMHVIETITFDAAVSRLRLSVPLRRGVGKQFRPTLSGLVVREPGPVTEIDPMSVGEEASVRFSTPADRVVLEYDASGVAVRSGDTSNPDRALALVTPLVVAGAGGLPATVDVQSVKVLNVGCLRGTVLAGCGTQTPDGWTVETAGGPDRSPTDVLAQLNLAVP
jgi:hypothetical protein